MSFFMRGVETAKREAGGEPVTAPGEAVRARRRVPSTDRTAVSNSCLVLIGGPKCLRLGAQKQDSQLSRELFDR